MNQPYIKTYNELGEVSNPITKNNPLISLFGNRKKRREIKQKDIFIKPSKNFPLVIYGQFKFMKREQWILQSDGTKKVIKHYYLR